MNLESQRPVILGCFQSIVGYFEIYWPNVLWTCLGPLPVQVCNIDASVVVNRVFGVTCIGILFLVQSHKAKTQPKSRHTLKHNSLRRAIVLVQEYSRCVLASLSGGLLRTEPCNDPTLALRQP